MKISKVVFCLVLANALFAGGENLYTLKNNTLLKVTEVSKGQYKDSNGDSVDEKDILIISKMNDGRIAFGKGATSSGVSMALGYEAQAGGGASIAFGAKSKTKENNSIAIGTMASAEKEQSIAIGIQSKASNADSIAIGTGSNSIGDGSISLGYLSQTNSDGSIAIGDSAKTHNKFAEGQGTAIGFTAQSYGYGSIAVGTASNTFSHNSVAIGSLSRTGDEKLVNQTLNNYMLSVNEYNKLSEDKKDFFQKHTIVKARNKPNSNQYEYYEEDVYFLKNKWQTAIGEQSWAKGYEATALGANSKAFGHYSLAIGIASQSKAKYSSAIGYESEADGEQSIALGYKAKAIDTNSTAIGYSATAQKLNSIAIGPNAKALKDGSLALGSSSIADTEAGQEGKYFGVGENAKKDTATWTSTAGAVSVGGGKVNIQGNEVQVTRQITNVAAGTNDTDAVNVAQLQSLKKYSDNTFINKTDLKNIQDNLNGKISNIEAGDKNIVVESKGTDSKKISLNKKLNGLESAEFKKENEEDKTTIDNKTIEIGDDKIKTKISKNQIVLSNENNNKSITIKNDDKDQHILGLSNTTWNENDIVVNRAATEGQLQALQNNLENNLNNNIDDKLGSYKLAGNTGNYKLYDKDTLTIKSTDKNIETKATANGNLDITLSKDLNLKDGSITFDKTTLDEKGLSVNDGKVKITKNGVTIKTDDPNKPVELTQNGLKNGNNRITNVADGIKDNDAATVGQIRSIKAGTTSIKESENKEEWAKNNPPKATGKNSLSIGGGSTDGGRDNTVSVGAPGHERTISNVANPVKGTDAVNLNYLNNRLADVYGEMKNIKDEGRAGSASAIAIGGILQATIPGKNVVSISGGNYENQNAVAFGVSGISSDGQWLYKAGGSYDTQNNHGFQVSVGFQF